MCSLRPPFEIPQLQRENSCGARVTLTEPNGKWHLFFDASQVQTVYKGTLSVPHSQSQAQTSSFIKESIGNDGRKEAAEEEVGLAEQNYERAQGQALHHQAMPRHALMLP